MVIMKMMELGEVLHFARSGRLIVKLHPSCGFSKIGQIIFDNEGTKIGRIIELIGSVKAPFASVLPDIKSSNKVSGMKVFEPDPSSNNRHPLRQDRTKSFPSRAKLYKGKRK
jgi:RNA-binding protein